MYTSPHEKRLKRRILLIGSLTCQPLFSAWACKNVFEKKKAQKGREHKQSLSTVNKHA